MDTRILACISTTQAFGWRTSWVIVWLQKKHGWNHRSRKVPHSRRVIATAFLVTCALVRCLLHSTNGRAPDRSSSSCRFCRFLSCRLFFLWVRYETHQFDPRKSSAKRFGQRFAPDPYGSLWPLSIFTMFCRSAIRLGINI